MNIRVGQKGGLLKVISYIVKQPVATTSFPEDGHIIVFDAYKECISLYRTFGRKCGMFMYSCSLITCMCVHVLKPITLCVGENVMNLVCIELTH